MFSKFNKFLPVLCFFGIILASFNGFAKPKKSKTAASPQQSMESLRSLTLLGQPQQAIDQVEALQKKSKGDWKNRLQFLAAYLNYQAGNFDRAAQLFENLDKDYPELADYVRFYRAISLRESGAAKDAIEILQRLKAPKTPASLAPRIDRELALAFCAARDRGSGIELLNQLIQTEPREIKTYHLRFDRVRCLISLGDYDQAHQQLRSLYLTYPEGDLSAAILTAIRETKKGGGLSAEDHLGRAEQLLSRDRPDLALEDLEEAIRLGAESTLDFKRKRATAYFKARRYREAAVALEEIRGLTGSLPEDELEQLAKSYSRSDQFDRAAAAYQELMLASPPAKQPALAYKIAFIAMDKGELAQASEKFVGLLEQYPSHPQKEQILWFLAWIHYRLGNDPEALEALGRYEAVGGNKSRTAYWRARILDKQNRATEARVDFEKLAAADRFSYYGLISRKQLKAQADPSMPPSRSGLEELPRIPIPKWLPKESSGRLRELLLVGLWEDFLAEMAIASQLPSDSSPESPADEGGAWSQRYPAAYPALVSLFAASRNLPLPLAWAVMREESRFKPEVVSPAKAIGLMQIIPPTGFEIARNLGRQGFQPDDLFQPLTNIEFGVHYLAMNLARFKQNLVQTIASYNAGPEAVERWVQSRPDRQWDEFVEEIPYAETQNYVRKVLRSYYIYSLIYQ